MVRGLVLFFLALVGIAVREGAVFAQGEESVEVRGARLSPPRGFRRIEDELACGSSALVPLVSGEAPRGIVGVFVEADVREAATLVIGRVEQPLELGTGVRGTLAFAIASHFRSELDLEVVVDRPKEVDGKSRRRLEARARTDPGRGWRTVRFAFVPAGPAYYVLAASFPADREKELEDAIGGAFDSFTPAVPAGSMPKRAAAARAALFGAVGVLVAVAVQLWRRGKRRGGEEA